MPFAEAIRREAGIADRRASGMITEPQQAEEIVATGRADAVLLARASFEDPYWPLKAAGAPGDDVDYWPRQYLRGKRKQLARRSLARRRSWRFNASITAAGLSFVP